MTESEEIRFVEPQAVRAVAEALSRSGVEIESELKGPSMGQSIPSGARIRIAFGTPDLDRMGPIVVFSTGEMLVAHRVVRIGHGLGSAYVLTRGDGKILCDVPVHRDQVLGYVSSWNAGAGWQHVPARVSQGRFRETVAQVGEVAVWLTLTLHPGLAMKLVLILGKLRDRMKAPAQ